MSVRPAVEQPSETMAYAQVGVSVDLTQVRQKS